MVVSPVHQPGTDLPSTARLTVNGVERRRPRVPQSQVQNMAAISKPSPETPVVVPRWARVATDHGRGLLADVLDLLTCLSGLLSDVGRGFLEIPAR